MKKLRNFWNFLIKGNLQKRTNKTLSTFRSTIESLNEINSQADECRQENTKVIKKLSDKNTELTALIAGNEKVVGKLEDFLK